MMLSVILICFNQKDFIAQAIESILSQQSSFDYEIIIGDDCSTDGTSEIIKYYADVNSTIKYFRHSTNLGLIGNFIFCHEQARGKYIATIDGDDYWIDNRKLSKQVEVLECDNKMGMVHTQYDNLYMYPKFFGKRYVKHVLSNKVAKINCSFEGIYSDYSIRSSTVCYRRKIVDDYLLLEEFKKGSFSVEDWPVHLLCSMGRRVGYIPQSTTVYRVNRVSLSHFEKHDERLAFFDSLKNITRYFENLTTISYKAKERRSRSLNLCLAYHYYRVGNYSAFKDVYSKIKEKPSNVLMMYLFLWLKKNRILRNEDLFKL